MRQGRSRGPSTKKVGTVCRIDHKLAFVDPGPEARQRATHRAGTHRRPDRHPGQVAGLGLPVSVVNGHAHAVLPGAHHLGVERLARGDGMAKGGKRAQLAALGHGAVLGGRHAQHVDPLALEQLEALIGVETAVVQQRRGASQPGRHEGVTRRQRPAAGRGAPAQVALAGVVPVLGLHALALQITGAVADRLRCARGAGGEHDQRGTFGLELDGGGRLARLEQAIVRQCQDLGVETGVVEGGEVAFTGDHGAGADEVGAGAQVGRAQLFAAGQRRGAEAPARHHRIRPFGLVTHQRQHHVAAVHAPAGERTGQAGRALGDLAKTDLAALVLARDGNQGRPPWVACVDHVPREVHAGQRPPRAKCSRPRQSQAMVT